MKLYRLVLSDEIKDIKSKNYQRKLHTNVSTNSGFNFKEHDKFGKYFFIFKEDAIKFMQEFYDCIREGFYSIDEMKNFKFNIIEIDVDKVKILKNIGLGLYSCYDNFSQGNELRIEVLLPFKDVKNYINNSTVLIETYTVLDFDELVKSDKTEYIKKSKLMLNDVKKDFNISHIHKNSFGVEELRFEDNQMVIDKDSVSKKLDLIDTSINK